MVSLRQGGIYGLPDGEMCVARRHRWGYWLYRLTALERSDPPQYEVDSTGQVHSRGSATPWRVEDLVDTGWTRYRP